jgi:uncharacterized Zn finger protein
MAIADPRLHIICGICGCNKELDFEMVEEREVYIRCRNCSSVTSLRDVMIERVQGIPATEIEEDQDVHLQRERCAKGWLQDLLEGTK